jgi:hypothetical protein
MAVTVTPTGLHSKGSAAVRYMQGDQWTIDQHGHLTVTGGPKQLATWTAGTWSRVERDELATKEHVV